MAQRVMVVCDLHDDGDEVSAESVSFSLEGTSYELDLCAEHLADLHDAVAPFTGVARRAARRHSTLVAPRTGRSRRTRSPQSQEIREWARAEGYQVSDRGRISADIRQAYDSAH